MDYKSSGVDIDAGNETVRRIKRLAKATFTPGVLSDIGSFGGLFKLDTAGVEGAGARVERRRRRHQAQGRVHGERHRTIGADLVNHCVNDILVQGATPLFFLDYLATGRLSPDVAEQIVEGLAQGVPGQRLRAARRRDRGDARLLRRRRIRRRRLHRRRRRSRADHRRTHRSRPATC